METTTTAACKASDLSQEDRDALRQLTSESGILSANARAFLTPIIQLAVAGRDFDVVEVNTLTIDEAAERLRVPVEQVLRLIKLGRLPAIQAPSGYRVASSAVDAIRTRRADLVQAFEEAYENEAELPPYSRP